MNSNQKMIKKLRTAINGKGHKITYSTTEVFLTNKTYPSTLYTIKKVVYDSQKKKNRYIEVFKTYSQIQVVLFLRDYWYMINDMELPTDNEKWNEIRNKIDIFQKAGE